MTASTDESSAADIAKRVETEYHAREQLNKRRPFLIESLTSAVWTGLCVYIFSRFDAPLIPSALLLSATCLAVPLAFEVFYLRRRLDAALMLLGMSKSNR